MKRVIFILGILSLIFIAGCSHVQTKEQTLDDIINKDIESIDSNLETETVSSWMDVELKDVQTQETFKISDFKGKNILLESFAAWCPTCTKQQNQIKILQTTDKETIHISLDTDSNEDEDIVKAYIERNLFDWNFAISPPELTRAIIDEFGLRFVFAPSAPIILICKDQSTRFLGIGVKSADKLKLEIEKGC